MWRTSYPDDDVPQVLESLDLPGIAKFIKSDLCKNIFIMAGAGISTSAGIPDFRSPDTGLYANLARLKLPYPEAVFDINFFRRNPRPFYVLAHELAPGKFRPTPTHAFIRLLAAKSLLHTCFTQNIDTLERAAGVPAERIVEAHGSFADQHCIECGAHYPHDEMRAKIAAQEIPTCERRGCSGYVKPDIVFFGESLPDSFVHAIPDLRRADLLIVMGTSLTVMPFASLTNRVPEECPRLLLNLDSVGDWGSRSNDVAALMPCDDAVRELCRLLGWDEELERLWTETQPKAEEKKEGEAPAAAEKKPDAKETVDEVVDELAKTVGAVKLEETPPAKDAEIAIKPTDNAAEAQPASNAQASAKAEGSETKPETEASRDKDGDKADAKDGVDNLADMIDKGMKLGETETTKEDTSKDLEDGKL